MRKLARIASVTTAILFFSAIGAFAAPNTAKGDTEIRQLLDRWSKAFRAKDLEGVMKLYAPGTALVAYDIVPPLRVAGKSTYQKNYEDFFAMYEGPIEVEIRDVKVIAGKDIGFLYCLERISGTLKGGQKSDIWLRATSGLQKTEGRWLIVHDHISVPTDFATGKALLDLKP